MLKDTYLVWRVVIENDAGDGHRDEQHDPPEEQNESVLRIGEETNKVA